MGWRTKEVADLIDTPTRVDLSNMEFTQNLGIKAGDVTQNLGNSIKAGYRCSPPFRARVMWRYHPVTSGAPAGLTSHGRPSHAHPARCHCSRTRPLRNAVHQPDLAIARATPVPLGLFSFTTLAAHALREHHPITQRTAAWYDKPSPTFVDAIALVRRHLWLASEGFSLSAANSDTQELPVALYHRLVDSLAYAA